ncbi:MAG: hypothetical protein ACFCUX_04740 [Candidatus Methylacidiphilales bacterium]
MMNKPLGYFCLGILTGAVIIFGFHNAMLKRERTFAALHETAQQILETRLLAQGDHATLDLLMQRNLELRVRNALKAGYPSRDRILGFTEVYYSFTGKSAPDDIRRAMDANPHKYSTQMLDDHLKAVKVALANPDLSAEELKALLESRRQ